MLIETDVILIALALTAAFCVGSIAIGQGTGFGLGCIWCAAMICVATWYINKKNANTTK